MDKATFRLDSLEQDHDTFELADGTEIPFRNRGDFTSREQARAIHLGNQVEKLMNRLERSPQNDALANKLEEKQREFLRFILPDIPSDVAGDLNAGKISVITQWWQEQQESRYGENGLYGDNDLGEG